MQYVVLNDFYALSPWETGDQKFTTGYEKAMLSWQ